MSSDNSGAVPALSGCMTTLQWHCSLRLLTQQLRDFPDAWAFCNSLQPKTCCSDRTRSSMCSSCRSDRQNLERVAQPQILVIALSENTEAADNMSPDDWHQLVLVEQVPKLLAAACCKLLDSCGVLGQRLTVDAWVTLLNAADRYPALKVSEDDLDSTSVLHSIGQQMEQGGLLQRLPQLMLQVALMLQSADSLGPDDRDTDVAGANDIILALGRPSQTLPTITLVKLAYLLLHLPQFFRSVLPPGCSMYEGPVAGPYLVSLAHLELATIQYVSRCLELLPAGTPPQEILIGCLGAAICGKINQVLWDWSLLRDYPSAAEAQGRQVPDGAWQAVAESRCPVMHVFAVSTIFMHIQVLLQRTNAGSAGAAAAAAAATPAGQGHQQAANRGRRSKRSGSGIGAAAAAAAAAAGSAADPTSSSTSSSSSSSCQVGSAEWQQATAALAHVPGSFSRLTNSLGIGDTTALLAAALLRTSIASEVDHVITIPAVCLTVLCKVTDKRRGEHDERVSLLAAAWLQFLLHLPRSRFTRFPSDLREYLREVGRILQYQLNPAYCMELLLESSRAAHSRPEQAQSDPTQQQQQQEQQRRLVQATAEAQLVMENVFPQLLPVWDLLQQLLQSQQPGQTSAEPASQPSLQDCLPLFGSLLWTVTACCILLMNQQPAQHGSKNLSGPDASRDQQHAGQSNMQAPTAAAASPAAAALKQQTVQLLGLWEAYARCRATVAAAAAAAGSPMTLDDDADDMGLQYLGHYGLAVPHNANVNTEGCGRCDYGLLVTPLLQGSAPGSPEQLQLFHVLCSLLKLNRVCLGMHRGLGWAIKSADAAAGCVAGSGSRGVGAAAVGAAAGAAVAGAAAGAAAAAAADPHVSECDGGRSTDQQLWSAEAAAAAVLWLRVLGLCCLQLDAYQQEQQPPTDGTEVAAAPQQQGGALHDAASSDHDDHAGLCWCSYHLAMDLLKEVLECTPLTARLAAQGYDVQGIAEQTLESFLVCALTHHALLVQMPTGVAETTGLALLSLATPYACDNPTCSNVLGPSELLLVNGRSCVCGGCRVAHYCSRVCLRQHWKQHKPVCQALAAASAPATATAAQ